MITIFFHKYASVIKLFMSISVLLWTGRMQASFAAVNDFDVSNSTVIINDFIEGGPEKDGIPSLDKPVFVSMKETAFLKEDDYVAGVLIGEEARAYPLKILNWHEAVNDIIAEMPIAVTWCPLTKSAIVFKRMINDEILTFGVSGLLYNSNLVLYDRSSNSLWPQLALGAVTGRFSSQKLSLIPSRVIKWGEWRKRYPDTLVLSKETGFLRDYSRNPYTEYHQSQQVMFPLKYNDRRLSAKTLYWG